MLAKTEAPSPFLPGTKIQYAWDSTSLGALKHCPRYYQYVMIDGYQPMDDAIHLRFGIEYHQALHDYEKAKLHQKGHKAAVMETVKLLLTRINDWNPEPRTKSEELKSKWNLLRTVIWYLEKFKDDPAETVIFDDGRPAMEVSFKFELDFGPSSNDRRNCERYERCEQGLGICHCEDKKGTQPYLLCGHLDRIVTYANEVYVMDRKTTTSTPGSYYFDNYAPDNQMTIYSFAGQVVLNSPIKGVIIDAAQVAVGFSHFVRGFTYRTPDQIEEWLKDLRYWLGLAEQYATEGYWPMNDQSCSKFGGCRFRGVCSKSPQVRQQFLKADFVRSKPWNPLESRT